MEGFIMIFLQSILAGIEIAVGGFLFIGSKWLFTNKIDNKYIEFGNVIGSLLFGIGLLLVCKTKAKLYTGRVGLLFEEPITCYTLFSLIVMLIGNVGSCGGVGYLIYYLMNRFGIGSFLDINNVVANAKINLSTITDYVKLSIQSILCGSWVHIAVRCYNLFEGRMKGCLILLFSIFTFVYSGYQHCIANCFYFMLGNLLKETKIFINVGVCIVGNMLGTIPVSFFTYMFRLIKESEEYSISPLDNRRNTESSDSSYSSDRRSTNRVHVFDFNHQNN